jgi:hypothetical protein
VCRVRTLRCWMGRPPNASFEFMPTFYSKPLWSVLVIGGVACSGAGGESTSSHATSTFGSSVGGATQSVPTGGTGGSSGGTTRKTINVGGSAGSGGSSGVTTSGTMSAGGSAGSNNTGSGGSSGSTNTCGTQRTRLRVTNYCTEPLWLQHSENIKDPQSVRVAPKDCYDYAIPDAKLASTRVWAKTGCDAAGANCTMGQSVAPCPAGGCQPPIESKFEATFADPLNCPKTGAGADCLTWYNASQVDGYTLPFRITPLGEGSDEPGCVESDCSKLDLTQCPSNEDLSEGVYSSYLNVDLRVFDPKIPTKIIGCMSPCKKLNYVTPWGFGLAESGKPTVDFCCPTPPISSEACSGGPVASSAYVTRMHQMCPSVYSYAYDDAAGLHTCPAQTKFEVVFCP